MSLATRWLLAILVLIGIGGIVYAFAFGVQARGYISRAQIHVVKRPSTVPADKSFVEDYMSTQAVMLRSQTIAELTARSEKVKRRMEEEGFRAFPDAKKVEDLIGPIMSGLTVNRQGTDNVLQLSFTCADREEAKIILDNLIESYQRYLDEVYQDLSHDVLAEINRARTELERRIAEADDAHHEAIKAAPIGVFENSVSLPEEQCRTMARRYAEVELHARELTARLETLTEAAGQKESSEIVRLKAVEWAHRSGLDKSQATVENYLAALRLEKSEFVNVLASLRKGIQEAGDNLKQASKHQQELQRRQEDKKRTAALLESVQKKAAEAASRRDAGGYKIVVITRPGIGVK